MQSIRSSEAKGSLRKSAARMTTGDAATALSSSLSRAILEPEFPEEEERVKKGMSSNYSVSNQFVHSGYSTIWPATLVKLPSSSATIRHTVEHSTKSKLTDPGERADGSPCSP